MPRNSKHIESNEHVRNLEKRTTTTGVTRSNYGDRPSALFSIQQTLERVTGEILVYAAMVLLADDRLQLFESLLRIRLVPFFGFGILC